MIPINALMPIATMIFEMIKWIKESKDIDPMDRQKLLNIISDAQKIKTWDEL